jgi:serine/threonine protein kinase
MRALTACPTPEDYQRFLSGQVPLTDMEPWLQHLEHCATCERLLQSLPVPDTLNQLLKDMDTVTDPEPDVVAGLIALVAARGPRAPGTAAGAPQGPNAVNHAFLAPPRAPDELGWLGEYRVLRVLGTGGMGVVFLAEDSQLGRPVALKVLRPELAANGDFRQRFLREARLAAALQHDHVVTVYRVAEVDGVPHLAMQLLEGETLEQRLQREPLLPLPEVLRIGREIAAGLQAAHTRGLIHRDIKPANVWLEQGCGRVKLLDFGLARPTTAAADGQLTQAGTVMGTPAYMAPEQAEGRPLDGRCDLFSLGCVLYRLATGKAAFTGLTPLAIMKAVASVEPRPAKIVNSEVPPALSELIQRLLAKNPEDRPATAQGVVDVLATLERSPHRTARAHPGTPSLPHRDQPQPRSNRAPAPLRGRARAAVVAAAALLVVGGGWLLAQALFSPAPETTPDQRVAQKEGGDNEGKKDTTTVVGPPWGYDSLVSAPTAIKGLKTWTIVTRDTLQPSRIVYSPDGRYLYLDGWTGGQPFPVGNWDFTTSTLASPDVFVPAPRDLVTAPDGKHQARVLPQEVGLFPKGVGAPDAKLTVHNLYQVAGAAFSPDSKKLLIRVHRDGLVVVDSDNAELQQLRDFKTVVPAFADWLADGKTLLVGVDLDHYLVEAATGKKFQTFALNGKCLPLTTLAPDRKRVAYFKDDNTLVVADPLTHKQLRTVTNAEGRDLKPIWSPDSARLLYQIEGNALCILDVATGKQAECRSHGRRLAGAAFAPDGKTVASFAEDLSTRLWSVATGQHLGTIVLLKNGGWLAVSPDGHYRGSAKPSAEGAIIYRVKLPDDSARELSPAEFARQYGWQNRPERVQLTEAGRSRLAVDQPVEKK